MNQEYGNFSWQLFVYSCYIITAIILSVYIIYSLYSRKNSLKNIQEEGFFEREEK